MANTSLHQRMAHAAANPPKNQHVVDITIIWPDNVWEARAENEYLKSCLEGVSEHFEAYPLGEKEEKFITLENKFGRTYAEIHVSPCKAV